MLSLWHSTSLNYSLMRLVQWTASTYVCQGSPLLPGPWILVILKVVLFEVLANSGYLSLYVCMYVALLGAAIISAVVLSRPHFNKVLKWRVKLS